MGRRETKKRHTRDALERVALELFARDGYDATSVEDIASAAEVSERTFFRYFATKDDVVFQRADDYLVHLAAALEAELPPDAPTWEGIGAALRRFAELFEPSRPLVELRARIVPTTPVLQARASRVAATWRNRTAEVLAARYDELDRFDATLLAGLAVTALNAAVAEWTRTPGSSLVTLVDEAVRRTRAHLR